MKPLLLSCLLSFFIISCKTTQEITQEKEKGQNSIVQIEQNQYSLVKLNAKMDDLDQQIQLLRGKVEELENQQNQKQNAEIAQIKQELLEAKETISSTPVQAKLPEPILKVTPSKTISENTSSPQSDEDRYNLARTAFTEKKYSDAKKYYSLIVNSEKISNIEKNQTFHDLGLIYYWDKDYEKSLVYFSRVYTKWPKSSKAPNALLHIGRCFHMQKKNEEAKEAYKELIRVFPNDSLTASAKKELSLL